MSAVKQIKYNTRSSASPSSLARTATKRKHSLTKSIDAKPDETKKKERYRRRSSVQRRSLAATLECIQSNEVSSLAPEHHTDGETKQQEVNGKIPSNEKVDEIVTSIQVPSAEGCEVNSFLVEEKEEDDTYISHIKEEIRDWKKVVKHYRKLESDASERLKSTCPLNSTVSTGSSSSFSFYSQQLHDIEERLAKAVTVVSSTIENVHKIIDLHELKVMKLKLREINRVSVDRGGDDPRWLIENIFKLDNMTLRT